MAYGRYMWQASKMQRRGGRPAAGGGLPACWRALIARGLESACTQVRGSCLRAAGELSCRLPLVLTVVARVRRHAHDVTAIQAHVLAGWRSFQLGAYVDEALSSARSRLSISCLHISCSRSDRRPGVQRPCWCPARMRKRGCRVWAATA